MANDIRDQIKINIQIGLFGLFRIRLDKTTGIKNNSQLSVFIRCGDYVETKEDIYTW